MKESPKRRRVLEKGSVVPEMRPPKRCPSVYSEERPREQENRRKEEAKGPHKITGFEVFVSYITREFKNQGFSSMLKQEAINDIALSMWSDMLDEQKQPFVDAAESMDERRMEEVFQDQGEVESRKKREKEETERKKVVQDQGEVESRKKREKEETDRKKVVQDQGEAERKKVAQDRNEGNNREKVEKRRWPREASEEINTKKVFQGQNEGENRELREKQMERKRPVEDSEKRHMKKRRRE